jgi:hypothetical protein
VRSLFAGAAAVFFAYNASAFLPAPFAYPNEGQLGGIDGDPGAVAITWAARALFAGLALIALALVDWVAVWRLARKTLAATG